MRVAGREAIVSTVALGETVTRSDGGRGLRLDDLADTLPASAATGVRAVPVTAPRLVHRTELVHGQVEAPAAVAFRAALTLG